MSGSGPVFVLSRWMLLRLTGLIGLPASDVALGAFC